MTTIRSRERFDEPVTEQVLQQSLERGRARRSAGFLATEVRYLQDLRSLMIGLGDGSAVLLPIQNYPEFVVLSESDLAQLKVDLGGCALSLEIRDLHVSIAGLISASQPLMEMAVTLVAARNGARSSEAKSRASRQNGLKGGRPRKATDGPASG